MAPSSVACGLHTHGKATDVAKGSTPPQKLGLHALRDLASSVKEATAEATSTPKASGRGAEALESDGHSASGPLEGRAKPAHLSSLCTAAEAAGPMAAATEASVPCAATCLAGLGPDCVGERRLTLAGVLCRGCARHTALPEALASCEGRPSRYSTERHGESAGPCQAGNSSADDERERGLGANWASAASWTATGSAESRMAPATTAPPSPDTQDADFGQLSRCDALPKKVLGLLGGESPGHAGAVWHGALMLVMGDAGEVGVETRKRTRAQRMKASDWSALR
mmetsp:Transcript_26893/g.59061  ORF Transcript_26893/g.59061 Transcript_26893/m.59061 type:complete len:283 (+) Transcript_26893:258-1106(+)